MTNDEARICNRLSKGPRSLNRLTARGWVFGGLVKILTRLRKLEYVSQSGQLFELTKQGRRKLFFHEFEHGKS